MLTTLAQVLAVTSGLMTPVALPVKCVMRQAPVINIRPQTDKIRYDLSKTSAELSAFKSNTISPYGLSTDQTTGGLRHDKPYLRYEIKYNVSTHKKSGTFCLSYSEINVDIKLRPHIYIAKEFNKGRCGREVLEHEKKHVKVDRAVINKHAKKMGVAIQKAVNSVGAVGPFPVSRSKEMKATMDKHIESAIDSVKLAMTNEMNLLQQKVDSHAEYERVSKHCEKITEKVFRDRKTKN